MYSGHLLKATYSTMKIEEVPNANEDRLGLLMANLHELFAGDRVNIDDVQKCLAHFSADKLAWKNFANFHPER